MSETWESLTEVPDKFDGNKRIALQFLLKKADKVEIKKLTKGRSRYRAYFDDGVGKGAFVYEWPQCAVTPLSVYMQLSNTGWPGFQLHWLQDVCAKRMQNDLNGGNNR